MMGSREGQEGENYRRSLSHVLTHPLRTYTLPIARVPSLLGHLYPPPSRQCNTQPREHTQIEAL